MIPYLEALRLVRDHAPRTGHERVLLSDAPGRVAAEAVRSRVSLPPFDNSAMDGFALVTKGQVVPAGTRLPVVGSTSAGDPPGAGPGGEPGAPRGPEGGTRLDGAWEIMTGAPVPSGFDTVVPVEQVRVDRGTTGLPETIELRTDVAPDANLRRAGSDVEPGQLLMGSGTRVGAMEVMALAAVGVGDLSVRVPLKTGVLCTGPELVDDPARALEPGQIRNSNGPFLRAALATLGCSIEVARTLDDAPEPFLAAVDDALQAGVRLLISTGAVSMGKHDFVPEAVREAGGELLFHRAAIRPGKPVMAAVLPGGVLFLGLPGNPVSTAAGVRFFAAPAVREALGQPMERPRRMPLAEEVAKRPGLRYFSRVAIEEGPEGSSAARLLSGQESFRIAPLVRAAGWVVLLEEEETVPAGTVVDVYPPLVPHGEGG